MPDETKPAPPPEANETLPLPGTQTVVCPTDPIVKTVTIKFLKDTPIHVDHAVRKHCGRLQYRPYAGNDRTKHGKMESYYPAGTVLELADYVGSGFAEVVTQ